MRRLRSTARRALATLLCLCLTLWSFGPVAIHAQSLPDPHQSHAGTLVESDRSHELDGEDVHRVVHGHGHDVVDHDHSQGLLELDGRCRPMFAPVHLAEYRPAPAGPPRVFRLERPPRV